MREEGYYWVRYYDKPAEVARWNHWDRWEFCGWDVEYKDSSNILVVSTRLPEPVEAT